LKWKFIVISSINISNYRPEQHLTYIILIHCTKIIPTHVASNAFFHRISSTSSHILSTASRQLEDEWRLERRSDLRPQMNMLHERHSRWHQSVIVRRVAHVLPLQEHMYLAEGRPDRVISLPTFPHQVVNLFRTVGRLRQLSGRWNRRRRRDVGCVEATTIVNNLLVVKTGKRLRSGER